MSNPEHNKVVTFRVLPGPKTCILLLVLGVVINVLVAWGCVICASPVSVPGGATPEELDWYRTQKKADWIKFDEPTVVLSSRSLGVRWAMLDSTPTDMNIDWRHAEFLYAGWPMMGLKYETWTGPHRLPSTTSEMIPWEIRTGRWGRGVYILPVYPIWLGFIVDTLFDTAVLWGVVTGFFFWRSKRRLKRGLCPVCKYPIGGTGEVCSECGAALPLRPHQVDAM